MKKFFAIFLSLVMILSLSVPAFAAETDTVTSTEEGNNTASKNVTASYTPSSTEPTLPSTIYFDNSAAGWTAVNAYFFDGSSQQVGANWPGTAMTKVEGEENIYSIEVPAGAINVIFNDGTNQTADQTIPTDGSNMYDYDNSTWTTYTPSSTEPDTTATITGLKVTVDGVTYESGTVTLTPNSGDVTITVIGTNLQNRTNDNSIWYSYDRGVTMGSEYSWNVSADGTEASHTFSSSHFVASTTAHEILYSNDGEQTWTNTGIYVTYDAGVSEEDKAVITGVKVTVDGVTYESGTVTLTPNSGDVTITVIGTNLQNRSEDNKIKYNSRTSTTMGSDISWSVNNEGIEASRTIQLSVFTSQTAVHEIGYCNDGSTNYTGSGVYVIYQSKIVSVDITWGAMSFTYDDTVAEGENGWTCTEGANKITVANNSTVAVEAALAYAPANGYDWLGGYFELADGSSVTAHTIAASGSEDFYLILDSDKPEAAFSGTVGTVTVTITEAVEAPDESENAAPDPDISTPETPSDDSTSEENTNE